MTNAHDKLRVLFDQTLIQEYELTTETVTIGRANDNNLVLNNAHISRYQARLSRQGTAWVLENISQRVEIRRQGQLVTGPTSLIPGDVIDIAGVRLEFVGATEHTAQTVTPGSLPKATPRTVVLPQEPAPPAPAAPAPASAAPAPEPVPPPVPPASGTTSRTVLPGGSPPPAPGVPGTVVMTATPRLRVSYSTSTTDQAEVSHEYELTQPQVTIGRADENDIVIPIGTVSRHHATLRLDAQGYTIVDAGSVNGLLYQGALTKEQRLSDGDILRIDDELGNFITLHYLDPSRPAPKHDIDLRFTPGQATITIGRASDNAIVIDHPQVSAYHAILQREPDRTIVKDLDSTNGTYISGQRITAAPITSGDTLHIGTYRLIYHDDGLRQTDADLIRLDAINLYKAVELKDRTLVLINDISLSIQPKELVAVVGGSGTGKSTLLNALSGVLPAPQGTVLLNGDDYYAQFDAYRGSLGYVPQDDIINRELTVEQTLYYAARLRLPRDLSDEEIHERISSVLVDVDLIAQRHTEVSRLSGGQRKRVSIAVELLARPRLFFLDEPLTGLDPGISKRMMSLLRRLTDRGQTILLITHATSSVTVCDKIIFLGRGGKLCFFGSPQEALEFFDVSAFADIYALLEQDADSPATWEARFKQSALYQRTIAQPQAAVAAEQRTPAATAPSPAGRHAPPAPQNDAQPVQPASTTRKARKTSWWQQYMLLTGRYFTTVRRDRVNLTIMLLSAVAIGVIIALVTAEAVFRDAASPLTAQQVLFLLAVASVFIGTSNAAQEVAKENPIYLRERLVGLHVVPYILSKFTVLSTLSLLQSILLVLVVLPGVGLPPPGALLPGVLELIIGVWLTMISGVAMGLLVSAWAPNTDTAISVVPILLVFQIMLAGLIFPLNGWFQVASYPIVAKWSVNSLGTTVDLNRLYYQDLAGAPPGIHPVSKPADLPTFHLGDYDSARALAGRTDYTPQSHAASRRMHLLSRWGILLGMTGIFVLLACVVQRQKDRIWDVRR